MGLKIHALETVKSFDFDAQRSEERVAGVYRMKINLGRIATVSITLLLGACSGIRTSDYLGVAGGGDVDRSVANEEVPTAAIQEEPSHLPKCFGEEIFFRVMNASDAGSSIALKILGKPIETKRDLDDLRKVLEKPEYEHFANNLGLRIEEMKVLMRGLVSRKAASVSDEFSYNWVDLDTFNELATRALVKNPSGDVKRYLPKR